MISSLNQAHEIIWTHLGEGVASASSPFRQAFLATLAEGGAPAVRTVTLRHIDRPGGWLQFNTDIRAPKALQMQHTPRVGLLFYSATHRLQIRADGLVSLHQGDDLARETWDAMRLQSRRCYLAPAPPGAPHDEPVPNFPPLLRDRAPTREESEAGFHNFAVARLKVVEWDIYQVAARDPWRAGFTREEKTGQFVGEWRMP